jgi:hypothetical protein
MILLVRGCRNVKGQARHHAVTVEKRPVSEVARAARSWVYALLARYQAEGDAAFEPRSRRPKTSPSAISADAADLIIRLRKDLAGQGLDAGPQTIARHPAAPSPGQRLGRDRQQVPEPGRAGHSRPGQAAEVVLHPVRGGHAERALAVRTTRSPTGRTPRS